MMNHAITIKDVVFTSLGMLVLIGGGYALVTYLNAKYPDAWK